MKKLERYINKIKNKKVSAVKRVLDMLIIHFDEGKYALHIQCPWRICENGKVLLGSEEFYLPVNGSQWTTDDEWDTSGTSVFDTKIRLYEGILTGHTVKKIHISPWNDIEIVLSGNQTLRTFTNNSCQSEVWRLFRLSSKQRHIVARGNKKIKQE